MATGINGTAFSIGVRVTVAALSLRRTAFVVPLLGRVGYLPMIVATIAVASLAGPVGGA